MNLLFIKITFFSLCTSQVWNIRKICCTAVRNMLYSQNAENEKRSLVHQNIFYMYIKQSRLLKQKI
jgi:hypothetical protein